MNRDMRLAFLAFHRYTCSVTGRSFGGNYPMIENSLHEAERLTVHHAYAPDRTRERLHELAPLHQSAHEQVDNACKDAQIAYLKRELAGLRGRDGRRRRPIIERALHFIEQKDRRGETLDLAAYLKVWARPFKGRETPAYLAALKQEQTVDAPARKEARRVKRHAKYERDKARVARKRRVPKRPPPHTHRGKEPKAARTASRIPEKVRLQIDRPVLNGV